MLMVLIACSNEPSAEAGAEVYDRSCAPCHGDDGAAGVETNGIPAADLARWVPPLTDAQLTDTILDGTGEMVAVPLGEEDLADCIAYLRATFPG
jgi:mono/diheme cytochrome c family protein